MTVSDITLEIKRPLDGWIEFITVTVEGEDSPDGYWPFKAATEKGVVIELTDAEIKEAIDKYYRTEYDSDVKSQQMEYEEIEADRRLDY